MRASMMQVAAAKYMAYILLLALSPLLAAAQSDDTPQLGITTSFPGNELSLVKNGQLNRVVFSISNLPSADRVLTLEGITGAFLNQKKLDGQRGRVVRNMTTTKLKSVPLRMVGGKPVQVPYDFHSEFKPQNMDVEFRLLVADGQTSKAHNLLAYKGSVTIVEPPKSWFDIQLLSLYALLAAGIAFSGSFAYKSYLGGSKRKGGSTRKAVEPATAASVAAQSPAASSKTGYEEDWIPEQHLRTRSKKGKGKS
ncbi:hypothetical protein K437DRAFT_256501 [Tilletiaria anomala UBC 951]|uniref:Translocon-associated protein subunit alpha n=1 Tax=Tilletiaria anomala (strain ATCC 24038 / CBS 436.72 / UBC 951) TaxID=1037660 RepID=A0A066W464_TILAU|nr:uncharacterized protein K437DRAFT_256501 [Tilletiaria anomala UBC 951]KDN45580.1 hypothetical protein K437DRAFT_256501 [Tilletiaria anomala UBC 951]